MSYRSKKQASRSSIVISPAMSRDNSREGISYTSHKDTDHGSPRKPRHGRKPENQPKSDGTVASLRPTQALTVRENFVVEEVARLMAAKRADCVLVIDSEEHLSGIFTAKDLAFKVVGDGMDAKTTTVAQIMTREPKCVKSDTLATDALDTMVSRGFRHLPICNEDGDVVGLLDITKCLHEALEKMERAYGSSQKLYAALEGVEKEWSNQPPHILRYMGILREKMACPNLTNVLNGRPPVEVGPRASVKDIARLMRENRTTAVLVMERGTISGIFTSKDVVLRVIAAGLDPSKCPVVRVMTPHPDTAPSSMSILDALKKMYDGHYLNLPVVDGGNILGMVDVLRLTYAVMEQIYSIEGQDNNSRQTSGPMWTHFWESLTNDGDDASALSDSISPSQSASNIPPPSPNSRAYGSGRVSPVPEIHPSESASAIDDGSYASYPRVHDHGFTFKFTSPDGKNHRFTVDYTRFDNIREAVAAKLPKTMKHFSLSYIDDDNDQVLMATDENAIDAVQIAQRQGASRVLLLVQETDKPRARDLSSDESEEEEAIKKRRRKRRSKYDENDLPISRELLMPAAIITLSAAIIAAFAISKLSK